MDTLNLKSKEDVREIIQQISSDSNPVGMDAVYVHAVILDKLAQIEHRLDQLQAEMKRRSPGPS